MSRRDVAVSVNAYSSPISERYSCALSIKEPNLWAQRRRFTTAVNARSRMPLRFPLHRPPGRPGAPPSRRAPRRRLLHAAPSALQREGTVVPSAQPASLARRPPRVRPGSEDRASETSASLGLGHGCQADGSVVDGELHVRVAEQRCLPRQCGAQLLTRLCYAPGGRGRRGK